MSVRDGHSLSHGFQEIAKVHAFCVDADLHRRRAYKAPSSMFLVKEIGGHYLYFIDFIFCGVNVQIQRPSPGHLLSTLQWRECRKTRNSTFDGNFWHRSIISPNFFMQPGFNKIEPSAPWYKHWTTIFTALPLIIVYTKHFPQTESSTNLMTDAIISRVALEYEMALDVLPTGQIFLAMVDARGGGEFYATAGPFATKLTVIYTCLFRRNGTERNGMQSNSTLPNERKIFVPFDSV
uniref:Uncharacterized protein n=1 Tax=Romanomermis culicivorax TaxID=13658 RepID=A0A915KVR8_ROMCU